MAYDSTYDSPSGVRTVYNGGNGGFSDSFLGPSGERVRTYLLDANTPMASTQDYRYLDALRRSEEADMALAGQQQAQIDILRANAEGRGVPSIAQMQLARALSQNQANAAGLISSQRGLNPALTSRLVGNMQASQAQEAAGQGAMLRAQEQLAAQQLLGQTLNNVRGQSQNMFGTAGNANQAQNTLNVSNFQQTAARNAQIAENNRMAQERAQEMSLGLDAKRAQAVRDAVAGAANMGAQVAGFGAKQGWFGGKAEGGIIPGRAVVDGDHPANDNVPEMLSPGEVVIPRSIVTAPDAPERAAAFVARMKKEAESDPEMLAALYSVRR